MKSKTTATTKPTSAAKKLLRYFIQGIIILAPIGITAYVLYWLFEKVDSILRPAVGNIPGLGFGIIIVFVLLVGWLSSNFLMGSAINFFDHLIERTPGIKFIYTSTKDFFEAFAGDKRKFNRPILANVFADDVWIVGFLTDEEMQKFDMGADKVAVYVPQAYNFAGQLYILPHDKVRKIERITAGEAMKYAVTGGVVDLDAERTEEKRNSELLQTSTPDLREKTS
ncbi:MAG TPA: DUF502 domain-containing protein [Chitinophagaceae bacterium]|jgi:uncharacterized membrane protein|nr:DUF502 domain-containing protein [Chitinophagaceae bacterium]